MAHMHYKGTGQMHSFRGLLADGKQDKIRIEGATGEIAWRITKFGIMPSSFNATDEYNMMIWREEQTTPGSYINFNNDELLAVAYIETVAGAAEGVSPVVIFDNALFTRNIYVTHASQSASTCNYYIELEEVKVSAAGMAQLAVAAARRNRFTSE